MKKQLKDLKQSDEILEIRRVNPVFVSRYRQAMRQGDEFPPLIITQDDVIVSGNHRYEAYIAEYPEDYKVECKVKSFDGQADMIECAIKENAKHGNPLDGISRKRAILKLMELGKDEEHIASILGVSVKRITKLASHYVVIRGTGEKKPIKNGLDIAGKQVGKNQYAEHDKRDRAIPAWNQAEQLTRWLKNGWIDMADERNLNALTELAETLDEELAVLE